MNISKRTGEEVPPCGTPLVVCIRNRPSWVDDWVNRNCRRCI